VVDGQIDVHADGKAHPDGAKDVATDVTDAGPDADAAPVDLAALYAFPNAVNTANCKQLASCCAKDDAGPFDIAVCASSFASNGGVEFVNLANVHGGHITLNETAAAACIADQAAFSCGTYTSAEQEKASTDCTAAMTGKLDIGQGPCTSAWDCAPPAYCAGAGGAFSVTYVGGNAIADSGVTGVCTAMRAVGQSCTDIFFYSDCTLQGNGSPANFCNPVDGGAVCTAAFATGTSCSFYTQCASQICDYPNTADCQTSTLFDDPAPGQNCMSYPFPADAGDGG
jgi:hypothetical protein